jgi:hypothetical protein
LADGSSNWTLRLQSSDDDGDDLDRRDARCVGAYPGESPGDETGFSVGVGCVGCVVCGHPSGPHADVQRCYRARNYGRVGGDAACA